MNAYTSDIEQIGFNKFKLTFYHDDIPINGFTGTYSTLVEIQKLEKTFNAIASFYYNKGLVDAD